MSLPWIIAFSVGLAALGLGWAIYGYHLHVSSLVRRQRQFNRLEKLAHGRESTTAEVDRILESKSWIARVALALTGQLQGNTAPAQEDESRLLLAQAGFRGIQALISFQTMRFALVVGSILFAAGYTLLMDPAISWVKIAVAGTVAYLAPKFILRYLVRLRVRALANELPLFVDYLRMMHGSGVGIEQAMTLFVEERRLGLPVLASEFALVRMAIKSGRTSADALQLLAGQIDLPEFKELIYLINDTERYGAGIQEPLKQFSIRLAEKRRFDMQEYIGKLATRMVIIMVLFLLPALFIITAGPGFLAVSRALSTIS